VARYFRLEERISMMSRNVGGTDRAIRLIVGIALIATGLLHFVIGPWAIVVYVVGGVALATGVVGFCPAWSVIGINTGKVAHK
jgi:hypothetical protein